MNTLIRAFDAARDASERRSFLYGVLGRPDGTIAVANRPTFVYVRVASEGGQSITIARNPNIVSARLDMPVKMRHEDGVLVIVGVDSGGRYDQATQFDDVNQFGVVFHTHRIGTGLEYEVESLRLEPGRIAPAGAFNVYVNPFRYRTTIWQTWPGGTINLATHQPTDPNVHRWVIVGVNPVTNTAVAVSGADVAIGTTLANVDLDDIDIGDYIPCGAVQITDSDTNLDGMSRYLDAHGWFNDGRGSLFSDAEGNPADVAAASADGASIYAARRNHVHTVGAGVVTSTMLVDGAALAEILDDDGAGSGLDADLLDGNDSAYFLPAASYTAADVLAKILTVDGAASGLDADLLDGLSSAAFAAASHAHTSADITDFTEAAQDAIGTILVDTATIDFIYTDATPSITAAVIVDSIGDTFLRNSGALSVIGRSANTTGDPADISASAASDAVLRESGSTIGFGTIATAGIAGDAVTFAKMQNIATDSLVGRDTASTGDPESITLGTSLEFSGSGSIQRAALTGDVTAAANGNVTTIANNAVTNTGLRDSGALSIIGRSANTTGDPADISASAASDAVLRESGSVIGWGTVATAGIANSAVTNAKLADMAQATVKGRAAAAGTGAPTDLSAAQLAAIVNASIDHGSIAGLPDDDHTQYALLLGRAGGQSLSGGNAANDDLTLQGTTHATRPSSYVLLQPNGGPVGIGTSAPEAGDGVLTLVNSNFVLDPTLLAWRGDGNLIVRIDANNDSANRVFDIQHDAGTSLVSVSEDGSVTFTNSNLVIDPAIVGFRGDGNMIFRIDANNDTTTRTFIWQKDAGTELARLNEAGNFGIANNAPQVLLHVGAGADASGLASTLIMANAAGAAAISVRDSTNNAEIFMYADSSGGVVGTITNHALYLRTNNTTAIAIDTSRQVGVGGVTVPTGWLSIKAGTSTDHANAGGVVYVSTAQVGNVGAGEDVLASFSVPANTLAVNGQSLWFEAFGTMINSASGKVVRARFGTSGTGLIFTSGSYANNAMQWHIRGRVVRTGAATQKGSVMWTSNLDGDCDVATGLNQTLSGAVTIEVTGEATTTNDILIESFVVGFDDQNS